MATTSNNDQPTPAPKTKDLVKEIGTLTYPRAVAAFGKSNAVRVMQEVAAIGGHGMFSEDELTSPLFGGLAMPDAGKVIQPKRENFEILPEGDFYYQQAVEEYEALKNTATTNRDRINDLFNANKKS